MNNAQKLLAALTLASVAATVVAEETLKASPTQQVEEEVTGLIAVTVPQIVTVAAGTPSYVVSLEDGGTMYMTNATPDAGWGKLAAGGCVRRKEGGSSVTCRRRDPANPLDLVGQVIAELNRFPADMARPAVNDCEPCACAVFQGEEANMDENTIVNLLVGVIAP
ncbi:MAG: hypothetical protein QM729_21440 [Solirubrobacterales bacterium]